MIDHKKIELAVKQIIEAIGENPEREGLKDTPTRIANMCGEIFSGLQENPEMYLEKTFTSEHTEPILVKDINFFSVCEHHFVPFFGKVHIAYIPNDGIIIGLSKLARVVRCISRRPQIQEKLTSQIADAIVESLNPKGVMVIVEAEHMCMSMRGIKNPGTKTLTCVTKGIFANDYSKKNEILSLIKE